MGRRGGPLRDLDTVTVSRLSASGVKMASPSVFDGLTVAELVSRAAILGVEYTRPIEKHLLKELCVAQLKAGLLSENKAANVADGEAIQHVVRPSRRSRKRPCATPVCEWKRLLAEGSVYYCTFELGHLGPCEGDQCLSV